MAPHPVEPELDEGLDPDGPSAADLDRFGDEYIACPNCGRDYYDQAAVCPHCGEARERDARGMPAWAIVTTAMVLVAIVLFWVF